MGSRSQLYRVGTVVSDLIILNSDVLHPSAALGFQTNTIILGFKIRIGNIHMRSVTNINSIEVNSVTGGRVDRQMIDGQAITF